MVVLSDLTKREEERWVNAALAVVEKHAAPTEEERLEWDPRGDVDHSLKGDMREVKPLEFHDGDFEEVEEL